MTIKKNTNIEMKINGVDYVFIPNEAAFNGFFNEVMPDDKIAPAKNYLMKIISKETKDNLVSLFTDNPGAALQLVEKVNSLYAPKLEIEIKN